MLIRIVVLSTALLAVPIASCAWNQDSRPDSPAKKNPATDQLVTASGKKIPSGARILSYKIW